jgi:hypothetical protein
VVRNNPCKVVFDDEDSIPAQFKEVVSTIKISKSAIGEGVPILTGRKRTLRNFNFHNRLISFNNL